MKKIKLVMLIACYSITFISHAASTLVNYNPTSSQPGSSGDIGSISSNPASVNIITGVGSIRYNGFQLGGAWIADTNYQFAGGIPNPKRWTSNNLFIGSLSFDTKKACLWEGGLFSVEFLQFNGQDTNRQAGSIQAYNSFPGPEPLNRSELYQLWYRQELFNNKLVVRIGKTVPTLDFNNVIKPVPLADDKISIPAVTGVIYTPIFVNASILGILPGFYNSIYGITLNFMPTKEWYLSYGVYDGNLARDVQTGIKVGPTFNGSYFHIAETGLAWLLGKNKLPGNIGIGVWNQRGLIQTVPTISEPGASGTYLFGSQRLWYRHPGVDNSGISAFYQYGINNSRAMIIKQYLGAGFTAFSLTPCRPDDSMGFGLGLAWLNKNIFSRRTELMLQTYYQAKVVKNFYVEPVLTYIPTPGASPRLNGAWAGTVRAILLF